MRILVVNYEFPPIGGGGSTATRYLTRELKRRGHVVDVLTSRCFGLAAREVVDGVTVYRVPVRRRRMDFCSVREMSTFLLSAPPKALQLASLHRYDLVHVFFGVPCGPIGWLLKRTHGLPYLIRMGGGDIPGFKPYGYERHYQWATPLVKRLWRDADGLIVVSADLEERVRRIDASVTAAVIPNGVDLDEFRPGASPTARGPLTILTVSRLISRKRIDVLLVAAARLKEKMSMPFRVEIVGDGVDRPYLATFAATVGVTDIVRFQGDVEHDRLPSVYQEADIFVLTSLAEGMPNVLLEALASGLPLIATNTGGSAELILPGVNGFVVQKESPDALAEHLQMLLEDPAQRAAFGRKSRERAQQFSWADIARRTETLYEKIRHRASA
ncbi:MAG: glycosyltransferase [Parcubacteria group bacterium Gr01-1014_38]|nr:MAG: glycosyltransferase [Parcubacteria group bacterium Gr01-1014_38]